MMRFFLKLYVIFAFGEIQAQHWVALEIKAPYFYNDSIALSQKSIQKKKNKNISIDQSNYGIQHNLLTKFSKIGEILGYSRWRHVLYLNLNNKRTIDSLKSFPEVQQLKYIYYDTLIHKASKAFTLTTAKSGQSELSNQLEMLHINSLQAKANFGEGIDIAIFDAGYQGIKENQGLSHLFLNKNIHFINDFVSGYKDLARKSNHGTYVLSTMAHQNEQWTSAAPRSNYFLFITEDVDSETPQEEINWAMALEMADSIGIDIINSSLGYAYFDNPDYNYSFEDLNGQTSIISKAARLADEKGILVVNSAGNEGDKSWRYIMCPADVAEVITVGAIDRNGNKASFSSFGWNALNQVKPDVVAVGLQTLIAANSEGQIYSNGTSFSSPIIASCMALVRAAHPTKSNLSLRNALIRSAHLFPMANQGLGYGIPNFDSINEFLTNEPSKLPIFSIYSNPILGKILQVKVNLHSEDELIFEVYDLRNLRKKQSFLLKSGAYFVPLNLSNLSSGIHILSIKSKSHGFFSEKFIIP
ncbi:MAG: S8 family serine peptidase [Chitinophagales bacterium]|nr:S8 family serine peptidase [Chitinophagales bacterium]